jgi:hypothetical protein
VVPEDPQITKLNFFYGNDPKGWVTDVPTYGRLRIKNIFPGTDLVLEPKSPNFWRVEGLQEGMVAELFKTVMEKVGNNWQVPPIGLPVGGVAHRANIPPPTSEKPAKTQRASGFPDQTLLWGTYLGGSYYDEVISLALDADDSVIATGQTLSSDFPTPDGYDGVINGNWDIFAAKLSADGRTLLWGTFIGGSQDDNPRAMVLDSEQNIVIVGLTGSDDIATTPDAFDTTYNGVPYGSGYTTGDIYVAKLSAEGNAQLWGTYIGGWNYDEIGDCALDAQGNVIIAGDTDSPDIPVPGGFYTQLIGEEDIYLAKLSGDGRNLLWATYLGGSKSDGANGLAMDQAGNIVIAGYSSSPDVPVPGGYDTTLDGEIGAGYIAKISIQENSILWGTYLEGTQGLLSFYSGVAKVILDDAGDVYTIGPTDETDMPVPGGFDTTFNGNIDMYLAKLSSDGSRLLWGSYLGGTSDDFGMRLLLNSEGDLLVLGYTLSPDMPVPNGYSSTSGEQFYLAKISRAGDRIKWGTYLGGWGMDQPYSMVLDSTGNILVGGSANSPDFPVPNGWDQTHHGFDDGVIAKITDYFGSGQRLFVPAAAHTPGAHGTSWRTDGMILNPGSDEVCYDLYYHTTMDGEEDLLCEHRCLAPDAAWSYEDIVGGTCGLAGATAGNLRVEPDGPLKMTTRTYTERADGGTYGQFVPAQTRGEGIGIGEVGHLIVLKQNYDYRTNIGFTEITGQATTVSVTVFDSSGSSLPPSSFLLPPYGWLQVGLPDLGANSLDLGRAEVSVTGGGAVLAYGSVVDNRTGDAIFVPTLKASGGTASRAPQIAAIAHTPGAYGTHWQSDIWLYNTWDTTEVKMTLYYYAPSGRFSTTVTLAPHEHREIQDIVVKLFPEAGEGAGELLFIGAEQILASSRTYNVSSTGTYGQFVPAKPGGQMLSRGIEGSLLQLKCGANYRTNVGFSEYGDDDVSILVEIHDWSGASLGSQVFPVQPRQNLQINDIFQTMNVPCAEKGAYLRMSITEGRTVYAYASVVDNRTGDAIFIPAMK